LPIFGPEVKSEKFSTGFILPVDGPLSLMVLGWRPDAQHAPCL
jgi:hypothetical protein